VYRGVEMVSRMKSSPSHKLWVEIEFLSMCFHYQIRHDADLGVFTVKWARSMRVYVAVARELGTAEVVPVINLY